MGSNSELVISRTEELCGTVRAPPSKGYTHRAVIAASMADGMSRISDPLWCDDTLATAHACAALGACVEMRKAGWVVEGDTRVRTPDEVIDCRDSASTMRFLTPVAALAPAVTVLMGGTSLSRRPMGPLLDALLQLGAECRSLKGDGHPPLIVLGGGISGGRASMVGNVSSQFVSGLLFACPLAKSDVMLGLTTELESRPYVRMTLDAIERFGIDVEASDDMRDYRVPSAQSYRPGDYAVPGDYSSAAFLLAAAALTNSTIRVTNLKDRTVQGDRAIVDILASMGANVKTSEDSVEVHGGDLKGVQIDARDTPDLVPVCAVLACYAKGRTEIRGAERLRTKESDRIAALSSGLRKMGARVRELEDGLVVDDPCPLQGTEVDPWNDHRIAMAYAVAALGAKGKTRIRNPECINKSYPDFIRDLRSLGVMLDVR